MKKIIYTPAPWYPLQFGGYIGLRDSDFYESKDILDVDEVGEDIAMSNGIIASKAPDMYKVLFGVIHHNDNTKEEYKLPKSLIEQITNILTSIEELKENETV